MVEAKVVKGIAFGAGCLFGIRTCLCRRVFEENASTVVYVKEMALHIDDLFLAHGYVTDLNQVFDLNMQASKQTKEKMYEFINIVYKLYLATREELKIIWQHFTGKEITYDNFIAIQNHPAVEKFLLVCAECIKHLEQLLETNNDISVACEKYLRTHTIGKAAFDYLLKDAIKLRMQGCSLSHATTPSINMFAPKLHV